MDLRPRVSWTAGMKVGRLSWLGLASLLMALVSAGSGWSAPVRALSASRLCNGYAQCSTGVYTTQDYPSHSAAR